jgi:hypothetical protein
MRPDEHLQPNRGWTLLRDAGQFTPAEIKHLNNCQECTDWLGLFADLALNAGIAFDVDSSFIVQVDQHMEPERGLALIRDGGKLDPAEQGHLLRCCHCNSWLSGLAASARKAGLTIAFEVPPWDRFH